MPSKREINRAADQIRRHTVQIFRASTTLVGMVSRNLLVVRQILLRELAAMDPSAPARRADQLRALAELYQTVRPELAEEYRTVNATVQRELADLALADQRITGTVYAELSGVPAIQPLPREVMRRVVSGATIEGAPSSAWWAKQATGLADRFRNQIGLGIERGETIGDMIRRVRGTPQKNYTDGVMSVSFRDAESLVRSSTLNSLNAVRMEQFKRTEEIEGYQVLTAFDSRVCPVCMALSGGVFDENGKRIRGAGPDAPDSHPPYHFSCRCVVVPVFASAPLADDLSFEDWLREQPEDEQRAMLGEGRHELWSTGQISLRDLIDQRGRPLSLAELRGMKEAA